MPGSDLTLDAFLRRAGRLFPDKEIISYDSNGRTRYTYATLVERVAQLANALSAAGVDAGARVASCSWNHHRHLEAYFAVPCLDAELHTVNPQLPDKHIRYMVEQAEDQLAFVDPETLDKIDSALAGSAAAESIRQYIVMGNAEDVPETDLAPVTDYDSFVDGQPTTFDWPELDENQPVNLCYTSGTTGKPKGVEYTHKMLWTNTMANITPQGHSVTESDRVLLAVPMFHVVGWCLPYEATASGAEHIYPGPSPSTEHLARIIEEEQVTFTAGVPTLWIDLLEYVEHNDADISSLERIFAAGAPVPQNVIQTYGERHDVDVRQGWGMTETLVGTSAFFTTPAKQRDPEAIERKRLSSGITIPGVEFRVIDEDGNEVPWDGESFGELQVKGPWITTEYFKRPDLNDERFPDGFLRTGDIATVDEDGYVDIVDRMDDMVKSGGEWISSVELENLFMTHDEVAEASVVGVSHERFQERPIAYIVRTQSSSTPEEQLIEEFGELVRAEYPKWWTPDEFLFVERIPRTSTGKFDKRALRQRYDEMDSA